MYAYIEPAHSLQHPSTAHMLWFTTARTLLCSSQCMQFCLRVLKALVSSSVAFDNQAVFLLFSNLTLQPLSLLFRLLLFHCKVVNCSSLSHRCSWWIWDHSFRISTSRAILVMCLRPTLLCWQTLCWHYLAR